MLPRSKRPMVSAVSVGLCVRRNHSTSIGAPSTIGLEARRPRAPSNGGRRRRPPDRRGSPAACPSTVARTPTTRPPSSIRPVASACISTREGRDSACPGRRGNRGSPIAASWRCKAQRTGRWEKSATCTRSSPNWPPKRDTFWCGSFRNSSSRPSSSITFSVEGWTVSPRKSRRKSPCFSSTTDLHAGARQQEAQHHARRAAAHDAALGRAIIRASRAARGPSR